MKSLSQRKRQPQFDVVGWATAEAALGAATVGMLVAILIALSCYTPKATLDKLTRTRDAVIDLSAMEAKYNKLLQTLNAERETTKRQSKKNQTLHDDERVLRQKLLGMQGKMDTTIFLVDISLSVSIKSEDGLERPNWGGDGSPWSFIRNQVAVWVKHLPVKHFRIVAFNEQIQEFPSDSRWANHESDSESTVAFLDSLIPTGMTNTENAIKRALACKPKNIVLITDGAPSNSSGQFDHDQVERIFNLVDGDTRKTPINVVAVNNYFDSRFGTFLHRLAAKSGGSFIGL